MCGRVKLYAGLYFVNAVVLRMWGSGLPRYILLAAATAAGVGLKPYPGPSVHLQVSCNPWSHGQLESIGFGFDEYIMCIYDYICVIDL